MIKKEILEIKKQLTPINCCLTRISGCYVNSEKEIVNIISKNFLSMDEEETFKFFELFRQCFSGGIGKHLLNMEYTKSSEKQERLLKLKESRLNDQDMIREFCEDIISHYDTSNPFYIAIVHGVYDIPGKTSDNMDLVDASEEVYEHLIGMICPVSLDKPSLIYNTEKQDVEDKIRNWVIGKPEIGFLFPSFTDRTSCANELLYYSKKSDKLQDNFIAEVFGVSHMASAEDQKAAFGNAVKDAGISFDHAKNLKTDLEDMLVERESIVLNDPEIKTLCDKHGMDSEMIQESLKCQGITSLLAENLFQKNNTRISTDSIEVKVPTEKLDYIEIKEVDGVKCLVIKPDGVLHLDGIPVHM